MPLVGVLVMIEYSCEILDYVSQLEKINTKNVPPTTRAVEVINVLREDFIEIKNP